MPVVDLLPPPASAPRRRAVGPAQANHLPLDPRVSRLTAVSRAVRQTEWLPRQNNALDKHSKFAICEPPYGIEP
jgi:hypothetical protein